jgi:hypothetical protein
MRRALPFFCLLLLAAWLPATQHCVLDAAGLITKACADVSNVDQDHAKDACTTVEVAAYKTSTSTLKVSAPDLATCVCQLCLHLSARAVPATSVLLPARALDRPRDWVATWQFVRRAAPLPRAPSLTLA